MLNLSVRQKLGDNSKITLFLYVKDIQGYVKDIQRVRHGVGTETFAKIDSVANGKTNDPFIVPVYLLLAVGRSSAFLLLGV